MAFIDFKKAYDSINRDHLFFQTEEYANRGILFGKYKSYVCRRGLNIALGFMEGLQIQLKVYLVLNKVVC